MGWLVCFRRDSLKNLCSMALGGFQWGSPRGVSCLRWDVLKQVMQPISVERPDRSNTCHAHQVIADLDGLNLAVDVGIAIINQQILMVYTAHLWWLGGWFMIAIPTLQSWEKWKGKGLMLSRLLYHLAPNESHAIAVKVAVGVWHCFQQAWQNNADWTAHKRLKGWFLRPGWMLWHLTFVPMHP